MSKSPSAEAGLDRSVPPGTGLTDSLLGSSSPAACCARFELYGKPRDMFKVDRCLEFGRVITKIKVPVEWVDFMHSFEARLLCTSELSCHFVGTHFATAHCF